MRLRHPRRWGTPALPPPAVTSGLNGPTGRPTLATSSVPKQGRSCAWRSHSCRSLDSTLVVIWGVHRLARTTTSHDVRCHVVVFLLS